jgi:hypothetical protein
MIKEIQITLYDIFGFLIPGVIMVGAISLFYWTIFWPASTLVIPSKLPAIALGSFVFAAYLVGHLGQAIGNLLEKLPMIRKRLEEALPLSEEVEELLRSTIGARFGKALESLKPRELFALCDQALLHHDSPGEREIFVYREGFYRGNSVALAILAVALAVRMVHAPAVVAVLGATVELYRGPLALACALAALGAWLAFRRYVRFGDHLFRTCFLRYLSLDPSASIERKGKHG